MSQQQQTSETPKDSNAQATARASGASTHVGNPEFPHVHPQNNALSQDKTRDIGW